MTITEITLIIIATYCIAVGAYLLISYLGVRVSISIKDNRVRREPEKPDSPPESPSIIGTTNFEMRQSMPRRATENIAVSREKNDTTFAPSKEAERNAQIPSEQMERTFTHDEISNEDEPLEDIEYDGQEQAEGVVIAEVQQASRRIESPTCSTKDKIATGKTLFKLEGSEILEQLSGGDERINKKIRDMMNLYLGELNKERKRVLSKRETQMMLNFDINDYA